MSLSVIILAFFLHTSASAYVNDWDQPANFECESGKSISIINSIHDNGKEDRRWDFQCQTTAGISTTCQWYYDLNNWDGELSFTCPNNAVISGINSHHDNGKEDRRFSIKCCPVEATLNHCSRSSYVSCWDEAMTYTVPSGRFLAGVYSVHSNSKEDRRWKFNTCRLG